MSLYVQESGPADAPTIVFLHGGGGAGWMWQPQVDALGDFHCVVPDLPEHGGSRGVAPFTIARSAELVSELIRSRAHGGRAHIVGLSEGAQIAVALLTREPGLVDHAIISSALVRPVRGGALVRPGLVRWSYRLAVAPFRNVDWWTRLNMKYAAGVPAEYFPQFRQTVRELTESGFTHAIIENQLFRIAGVHRVAGPVLIVVGEHEYPEMRASASDLASAFPGSRACEVVHARTMSLAEEHNWNLSAQDLFTATVRAFLADQELPGALRPLAIAAAG